MSIRRAGTSARATADSCLARCSQGAPLLCLRSTPVPSNRMIILALALWGLLSPWAGHAARPNWYVALVVDQSGSMGDHDPQMNAVVAPAILADLSLAGDYVAVHPQGRVNAQAVVLDPTNRAAFKQALLALPTESSIQGAAAAAFNSAMAGVTRGLRTAVVMVYDGDDKADLNPSLSSRVQALRSAGGNSFIFGMGGHVADTAPMAAFGDGARKVDSGRELLDAYAGAFRLLMGSKVAPPTGTAAPAAIRVAVPPGAAEAWFVVLANAEVRGLTASRGPEGPNPSGVAEPPGTGWTFQTKARQLRGYKVLRLEAPKSGFWEFSAATDAAQVDWLLVPIFDLKLKPRLAITGTPRAGQQVPVEVDLEGQVPDGTYVAAVLDGKRTPLPCQGRKCRGFVAFDRPGLTPVEVLAISETVEVSSKLQVPVGQRINGLTCDGFIGGSVPVNTRITVLIPASSGGLQPQQARLESSAGDTVDLKNDGQGEDKIAGDATWTASIDARNLGRLKVDAVMRTTEGETRCTAEYEVLPCVDLVAAFAPTPPEIGPCREGVTDGGCDHCGGCAGTILALGMGSSRVSGPVDVDLRLRQPLPDGLTAWVGKTALTTSGGPALRVVGGDVPAEIRICMEECPRSVGTVDLAVTASLGRAFACSSPGPAGIQRAEASLPIRPIPVGFLYCWRWHIAVAIGTALLLFIIYGFLRPLRFPGPKGRDRSFPRLWGNRDAGHADQLVSDTGALRSTRTFAVGGRWWTDQVLCFDKARNPIPNPTMAAITIQLRRLRPPSESGGKPRAGRLAWIQASAPLHRSKYTYVGQAASAMRSTDFDKVDPGGEELQLDHLYILDGQPEQAYLFRK